ncbi:putative disease resistance protein RGA3 [Panicum virgatum]|uniref:Uncharacterized protein n=1 Tax=Panicum virgatum TaxID=38727 RepID=A0A8T0PQ28_PANVG|nr:putative disease resistance protein RGA3 [Panicum virgatum]KAG2563770.1 hypothetical protein PVAP13_8KG360110 [Panicum virgatum]
MAAVLDAMVPYVKNLIAGMVEEEVNMLLGVSGEITKLEDNTDSIKAFLVDAERRRITEQSVQRWVNKLKDAVYDATDILDLCQLKADKRRESEDGCMDEKAPSCCQSLLFCLRNPVFAHKIGSRIKELNQRLEDIRKGANQFNFSINFGSYQDRQMTSQTEHSSRKAMSELDESAIVGKNVENDMKLLIQELMMDDNNNNIKVVSISGMGGIGKTTLAQKIFKETTIQEHFKTKIWLSIGKHFDDAELLRSAIKHAGRDHGEERDMSLLARTLTDALSASKFLVVMDDIWSDKAWSNVLCVPIRNASGNKPGSRVLVTTRLKDLASKMGESFHQHHVSPLDKEDAWSLLKKQLTPNQVVGIEQLKNIGMDILEKCDGLPLAIKVIGGLLSTRYPSELEWKAVLESPAWSVGGLPEQLDNRLYLSYEDLSPQLKQCFLYCSLFPKGIEIIQNVVTRMWISEGFIQAMGASSSFHEGYGGLEDIANQYYRELINRNLIEPTAEHSITRYRCTMHDVVRSFAEHMTRDESLVVVDDKQASTTLRGGSSSMLVRRLSLGRISADWAVLQRQKSLRTLIIYCRVNLKSGDSLGSFSSLRVLYIWSANSLDRLVDSLSKLKHLRYLHLENTDVSRLPEDIHKMKFLLHIDLLNCKKLGHLPSSITKLVHLTSLVLNGTTISAVPKGFGGLSNLRSLVGFPVHVDDMDAGSSSSNSWCSLQELAPLSQLRDLTLDGLEKVPACWMAEKAMISSKAHLNYLELNYNSHSASKHMTAEPRGDQEEDNEKQQQQQEEVLEKLCPPTCIENLRVIGGYVGCHLPNWMCAPASAEFKSLRYSELEDLPCCTHLPDGLRCLPSLELLDVTNAPRWL